MPRHTTKTAFISKTPVVHSKRSFRQRRARSSLRHLRHLRRKRVFTATKRAAREIFPLEKHEETSKWYDEILSRESPPRQARPKSMHKTEKKKPSLQRKRGINGKNTRNFLPKNARLRLLLKMKRVNEKLRKLYEENEISSSSEEYTSETETEIDEDEDEAALFY
jgi:hypothetical protein